MSDYKRSSRKKLFILFVLLVGVMGWSLIPANAQMEGFSQLGITTVPRTYGLLKVVWSDSPSLDMEGLELPSTSSLVALAWRLLLSSHSTQMALVWLPRVLTGLSGYGICVRKQDMSC